MARAPALALTGQAGGGGRGGLARATPFRLGHVGIFRRRAQRDSAPCEIPSRFAPPVTPQFRSATSTRP
jgi:hypothetical protein